MGQITTKPIKITFHQTHGEDVELGDNSAAVRVENTTSTWSNGVVFSAEPVKTYQKIYIKLLVVSRNSHDVISIGFTTHNPLEEVQNGLDIEAKSWTCSLSKYFCAEDTVICFFVDSSGIIHYTKANSPEYKVLNKKVDVGKPLWAVFYIWSEPTTIKLLSQNELRHSVFRMEDEVDVLAQTEEVRGRRKVMKDAAAVTDLHNEDNEMCIICYVERLEVVFVPCGHYCTCFQCGQWVQNKDSLCPICRNRIGNVVRVYKS